MAIFGPPDGLLVALRPHLGFDKGAGQSREKSNWDPKKHVYQLAHLLLIRQKMQSRLIPGLETRCLQELEM
jgi:hypothetical protein